MQSPSLPPEIPKHSLLPLWIGAGAVLLVGGVLWGLLGASSGDPAQKPEPAASSTPEPLAKPAPTPAAQSADPPPPPPPEAPAPARSTGSIPADMAALPAAGEGASARRDPSCADPCRGKDTLELVAALRIKASQARSCYERALSNDSSLAGKLEIAVRVGATGSACSASVASDTLGDAAVKSCVLARFLGSRYPKPAGGCLDLSVPMNFMPGGSR